MSDLRFDVDTASELKAAMRRAGATAADLNVLKSGDTFAQILPFLRGQAEVVPKEPKWQVHEDGTITLQVTSDGTTGPQWITRLESAGKRVSDHAKQLLNSDEFQPTSGVVYNVTILPGSMFSDEERITKKIRLAALNRGFLAPNAEVACLLQVFLTDEDIEQLGLWRLVVMHEPIEDSVGSPNLLSVDRDSEGQWLDACWADPGGRWYRADGFAFVAPAS